MLMKLTGVDPLFERRIVLGADLSPKTTSPKWMFVGAKSRSDAAPTPCSGMRYGLPLAEFVMTMLPALLPPAVGVKVMSIRHALANDGRIDLPQLFVWAKSPFVTMLEIDTCTPLVFASVTEALPPVTFKAWPPKSRLDGMALIALATPLP